MFRNLRTPLLRVRPSIRHPTLYRPLALASTETFTGPPVIPSTGPLARLYDHEPKKPNVVTELPGPKVRAAKEAMGKIQDVHFNCPDKLTNIRFVLSILWCMCSMTN